MSKVSQITALDKVLQKRKQLLNAIDLLQAGGVQNVENRVAIAEAEFRLAILPGTDSQEAIGHIQNSIALDPVHPKYYFHLGRLLHRNGDYLNAVYEFRHALKLAPASHRIYVHLALILIELDEAEKKLGRDLLDALARGAEQELTQKLVDLDTLLETRLNDGKKLPTDKHESKDRKVIANQNTPVPCRWNGVWRLALIDKLTRQKPVPKQITVNMERGEQRMIGEVGVAEYAIACLLLMFGGDSPHTVAAMLKGPKLIHHEEHPTVRLANAAVYLAESTTPKQFVERASEKAEAIPLEIICSLHYLKYGPESVNTLPVSEGLTLLNTYSQFIQKNECFRELRLAILDGYARKAWAEERFDHARLLWREMIACDSNRIDVFHNLALVATRTKSISDYVLMWARAAELRYLHAAALGNVQVMLDDRKTMHLSFAQQSRLRYCKPGNSVEQMLKQEELEAWLVDKDAIEVWLREWDLYYLNSRLQFNSPVHLLGIARDASAEMATSARDALCRQIETSLRSLPWAGIKTFCSLADQRVGQAYESFSDLVARTRDPYYDLEKTEAEKLSSEAIERGFILHEMMTLLVNNPSVQSIAIGCVLGRHLFALPWKILQPICVNKGKIKKDLDLLNVFENYFLAVIAGDRSRSENEKEALERLSILDECLTILPHKIELHIMRCQALLSAKKNGEVYSSALEVYALAEKKENKEEADELKKNCVNFVDNAAFAEMPERLLRPENSQQAEETLRQGCVVLENFTKAAGLRVFLADIMIQLGTEKYITQAVHLLEEGLEESFNDEQRQKFQSMLQKAEVELHVAGVQDEIHRLLKGASKRVNNAIEEINRNPGVNSLRKGREAIAAAIQEAERAKKLAQKAELKDTENQTETIIQQFKDIQSKLQDHK